MFLNKQNFKTMTSEILDGIISNHKAMNDKVIITLIQFVFYFCNAKSNETLEFWLLENFTVKAKHIIFYIDLIQYDKLKITRFCNSFSNIKYNFMCDDDVVNITLRLAKESSNIINTVADNLIKNGKYSVLFYYLKAIPDFNKKNILLYFSGKSKNSGYYKQKMQDLIKEFPELELYLSLI